MIGFLLTFVHLGRAIGRSWKDPEFRAFLTLLFLLILIGTGFYSRFEGWSILDSLYFCVVTLATVGYGDFTPVTTAGKIFTIVYIMTGVGVFVGVITKIAAALIRHRDVQMKASGDGSDTDV